MSLLFYGKFLFQIHRLRILPETYCQNSFKSFNHVSTKLTCLKGVLTTRKLLFTIFKLILSKIFPRRLEFWSSKLIKIAEKNFSFEIWSFFIQRHLKLNSQSFLMTQDVKKEKELKGFDQIYSRIPHLSLYQICILLFSSYTIILSGKQKISLNEL